MFAFYKGVLISITVQVAMLENSHMKTLYNDIYMCIEPGIAMTSSSRTDVFGASVGTKEKERQKQLAHDHRIPFLLPWSSSNLPSTWCSKVQILELMVVLIELFPYHYRLLIYWPIFYLIGIGRYCLKISTNTDIKEKERQRMWNEKKAE